MSIDLGISSLAHVRVIIPTLNAGRHLPALLDGLTKQPLDPGQILVIDSESVDETRAAFDSFGARVVTISRREFNHGGTRARAIAMEPDAEIIVMMTHDAIPANDSAIARLVEAFRDPGVGMAYGRQLPRAGANGIERFSRIHNYPGRSEIRSMADAPRLGVKTTFCSNSFAAYRRKAYEQVGGFPTDAFFAEDQIIAGRMLLAGWKIAYCADAQVFHSHAYSIREDFRRYFDVGVFHGRNRWLRDNFGAAEGEGLRFLTSELAYLVANDPLLIPSAFTRTFSKYLGYRLGQMENLLSRKLKTRLSMQPSYWRRSHGS